MPGISGSSNCIMLLCMVFIKLITKVYIHHKRKLKFVIVNGIVILQSHLKFSVHCTYWKTEVQFTSVKLFASKGSNSIDVQVT